MYFQMKGIRNIFFACAIFISMLLGMSACDNTRVYESWKDIELLGWHEDSLCVFPFSIEKTNLSYNINLGVRNTNIYPYQNMWLILDISGPENFNYQDTVKVNLADNTGKWYGKRSASFYSYVLPLYGGLNFSKSGDYTISVKHGMRTEELPGVVSLGFRVETVK